MEGARARSAGCPKAPRCGISGTTRRPVAPGVSSKISLRFVNTIPTTVVLSGVRSASSASTPRRPTPTHPCVRADFRIRQMPAGSLRVPSGRVTTLYDLGVLRRDWPRLTMINRPVNQDGCKGARLKLALPGGRSAVAVRTMTRRVPTGRTPILVAVTVLTLLVTGVAVAYWRNGGDGSATASSGTVVPVTLTPGTPTTQLHPGGQAGVVLTVTNSNAGPVRVPSLTLDTSQGSGGFAVDGAHSGCALTSLSYAAQDNGGNGWTLTGGQALAVTLANALSMSSSAANACQGASFTVYLKASP